FGFGWWRFGEESLVATAYGLTDVNYLIGERSQGLFLSESQNMVVVVSNGVDPEPTLNSRSFWAFTGILESLQPDTF
ncbi:MAG: hypothetical protein AAFO69_08365, partial [Bacteroidota bacterium]